MLIKDSRKEIKNLCRQSLGNLWNLIVPCKLFTTKLWPFVRIILFLHIGTAKRRVLSKEKSITRDNPVKFIGVGSTFDTTRLLQNHHIKILDGSIIGWRFNFLGLFYHKESISLIHQIPLRQGQSRRRIPLLALHLLECRYSRQGPVHHFAVF